ncbi:MAG TPA: DUF4124 domain-containing protein [Gallionellaceae bacterium]|nr:DUF4124 domain-containing protein [Gallionellaceae bacterium]
MNYGVAMFLLLISFGSHAALNKWVDADGKVHYSDTPPAGAKIKTLRSSTAPDAATLATETAAPKTLAEREAEWKRSQKTKEEAEQKASQEKEATAEKQKNCESARSNLATLENSPAIATYNEKGERTFMDDASRKQRTDEARKVVGSYCS